MESYVARASRRTARLSLPSQARMPTVEKAIDRDLRAAPEPASAAAGQRLPEDPAGAPEPGGQCDVCRHVATPAGATSPDLVLDNEYRGATGPTAGATIAREDRLSDWQGQRLPPSVGGARPRGPRPECHSSVRRAGRVRTAPRRASGPPLRRNHGRPDHAAGSHCRRSPAAPPDVPPSTWRKKLRRASNSRPPPSPLPPQRAERRVFAHLVDGYVFDPAASHGT